MYKQPIKIDLRESEMKTGLAGDQFDYDHNTVQNDQGCWRGGEVKKRDTR